MSCSFTASIPYRWILPPDPLLSLQPVRASGKALATLAMNIKRSRGPPLNPHIQNLQSITIETHFRSTTDLFQDALSRRPPLRSSAPRSQSSCRVCSRVSPCRDRCKLMSVSSEQMATRFDTNVLFADKACNCPNNCSHKVGSSCKYYNSNNDVVTGSK